MHAQFTYITNADNTITITRYIGAGGAVNIPATINGLPVTSIGESAFWETALTGVTIPDSVTSIGDLAFEECFTLTNVTIPDSVTSIGDYAFVDCLDLTAITVAAQNLFYSSANGVLFDKNQTTLIEYPSGKVGSSYAIPYGVTSIGDLAFEECFTLTNVTIPDSVTNIGREGFEDCRDLTSVTIPNSVTSIGDYAFWGCSSLTSIYFAGNAPTVGEDAIANTPTTVYYLLGTLGWSNTFAGASTVMLDGPPQFGATGDGWSYVGDGVQIIITGYTGFDQAVVIPSLINGLPVTGIASYVFSGFSSLTNVTIPDTVTGIGDGAFENTALTGVTIPDSVTSIGDLAFEDCFTLTSLTIGNGVTSIGDSAFSWCGSLTNVYFSGNAPSVVSDSFGEWLLGDDFWPVLLLDPATVYYLSGNLGWSNTFAGLPTVMLDAPPQFGTTTDGWNYVSDEVKNALITGYTGSNNVVVIPSLINGLPVTGIGPYAFQNSGLTSVTIPDSVTSIGDYAFDACSYLTSVTIGNNVTSIGVGAFANSGLTSVTIPGSVTNFEGVFGNFVTTLGAFSDCASLTNVVIGSGVTSIGDAAFYFDYGLASVTIPSSVTSIGDAAFDDTALTSVTIPNSVTTIGDYAFASCASLTSVTIGNSVTSIGDYAFYCISLAGVYFSGNAPTIGVLVFAYYPVTVYYLPGTLGWDDFSANTGLPTALWFLPQPLILTQSPGFGVQSNQFGFTISWATNVPVVVEACSNLSNPVWSPVSTNTLASGTSYFSDPQSANLPGRYYRLRSP